MHNRKWVESPTLVQEQMPKFARYCFHGWMCLFIHVSIALSVAYYSTENRVYACLIFLVAKEIAYLLYKQLLWPRDLGFCWACLKVIDGSDEQHVIVNVISGEPEVGIKSDQSVSEDDFK